MTHTDTNTNNISTRTDLGSNNRYRIFDLQKKTVGMVVINTQLKAKWAKHESSTKRERVVSVVIELESEHKNVKDHLGDSPWRQEEMKSHHTYLLDFFFFFIFWVIPASYMISSTPLFQTDYFSIICCLFFWRAVYVSVTLHSHPWSPCSSKV